MLRSMRAMTMLAVGVGAICLLVAAGAQATHPRPKGATPVRFSLVPSYNACTAPNRTHGPPLAFPSCNPPAQASGQATVGTADANGAPSNFTGYFYIYVQAGVPGPPNDSDVPIRMELSDVRCVPTGSSCGAANATGPADYAGELRFRYAIRFTDHWNAVAPGGGSDPATMQDAEITLDPSAVLCGGTASTSTGSTCNLYTSYNAFHPGLILDGKRLNEEIDDFTIYDGGPDGDANTLGDNTVFLRPGLFIP